jgi:NAD(P)H-flavin reductase
VRVGVLSPKTVAWAALLLLAAAAGVAQACLRYSGSEAIARSGGALLHLCFFILMSTMLRRCAAAAARFDALQALLPLSSLAPAHVAAGAACLLLLPLHVGGHIVHWLEYAGGDAGAATAWAWGSANPEGAPRVAHAAWSGLLLSLCIGAMAGGYYARVAWGRYWWFHATHAAGLPLVWAAFCAHSPAGGASIALPLALFLAEGVARALQAAAPPLEVTSFALLPAGGVELRLKRPAGLFFKAGQVAWLRLPALGGGYHPFAISSAPESAGVLTFHIRVATPGGWTAALRALLEQRGRQGCRAASSRRLLVGGGEGSRRLLAGAGAGAGGAPPPPPPPPPLFVHLDGPYGAPCQGVVHAPHGVLVAAGVGITPAASILGSLLARAAAARAASGALGDAANEGAGDPVRAALRPLVRLDLVWLHNEGEGFSWLTPLLQRFEAAAQRDEALAEVLRVHVYLTSLPSASDPAAAMLHLALDALCSDEGVDPVVGLRNVRTRAGRPGSWRELLAALRREAPAGAGATEVFFCGPPALGERVAEGAYDAGMPFNGESY